MNPFTESTVARPWSPHTPTASCRKKRRSLVRLTLGALGLATSLGAAHAVDVNSATQEQLQSVRGIGPKTAQVIIEERSRGGRYESFEDLSDRVKGIGPKKSVGLQAAGLTLDGQKTGVASGLSQEAPGGSSLVRPDPGKHDSAGSGKPQRPLKTGAISSVAKKSP